MGWAGWRGLHCGDWWLGKTTLSVTLVLNLPVRTRQQSGSCKVEGDLDNRPMLGRPFIIVSGLPAAGKTAIGRYVAETMELPFLDKDDLLELEFEKHASIDLELRQKLSRKSDEEMVAEAGSLGAGVLVSFWRPTNRTVAYGTATDWLSELTTPVIELHCRCEPHIAQQRFVTRTRHPGHNDAFRRDSLVQQFQELGALGPLAIWPVVSIDTSDLSDIPALANEAVRGVLAVLKQNS